MPHYFTRNKKDPVGWQVVAAYTDNPPQEISTYEVYPLKAVLAWLSKQPKKHRHLWRLCPVYEGDIQEAVFKDSMP